MAQEEENLKAIETISENVQKYKEQLGEKADAEEVKALEIKIDNLKKGIDEISEQKLDKEIKLINEGTAKMCLQVAELAEDLKALKDNANSKSSKNEIVTEKQLNDFNGKLFTKEGKKIPNAIAELQLKAAETFGFDQTFNGDGTGVQIDAFTGREIDPVLYQRKRKRNLILDRFAIPQINVPTLYYLEKEEVGDTETVSGDPGAADWITSGAAKPKRSFRLKTGKVEAKKVAIFATIEDKMLKDVASMNNWIREDLTDEMMEAINDGLLNNNPSVNADAPLGLKTNAVQYTATPAFEDTVDEPNQIDAIIAVIAFMADNKEMTGSIHISSDVYYRIHNLKATDGKYLNNNLIYVNNLGQLFIAGVQVISEDSEDVPSTHLLAISNDNPFKIRAYGNMVLETGLNGEDFREDKTSFRGYQEFLSYLPENNENGVVYDTFANIYAAILKPA